MKAIKGTIYQASDGTQFLSEADADKHEAKLAAAKPETIVAGRSVAELLAAIAGENEPVRDAVEALARLCEKGRYARGEYKRPPRSARGYTAVKAGADVVVEDGIVTKSRDGEVGVPAGVDENSLTSVIGADVGVSGTTFHPTSPAGERRPTMSMEDGGEVL